MKNKRSRMLVIATAVLLFLFCERLTGMSVHMIVGLLFVIGLIVHTVIKRKAIKNMPGKYKAVDYMLLFDCILILTSGVLAHIPDMPKAWLILHSVSACIFVILLVAHMIQHRMFGTVS